MALELQALRGHRVELGRYLFWLAGPVSTANPLCLEACDETAVAETEPNDSLQHATEIATNAIVGGQFGADADEDWFRFLAKKDQLISLECTPFPKSSPALPVVTIRDGSGNVLVFRLRSKTKPDRTSDVWECRHTLAKSLEHWL